MVLKMYKIIDCHVHVGEYRIISPKIYGWMQVSSEDLLNYMSDFNIKRSWLLSHPKTVPNYDLNDNKATLDIASRHPDLVPFCTPSRASDISTLVKMGCKGIGEIKNDKPIDHSKLLDIYRVAADFNLPVLIHVSDKYCYGSIDQMEFVFNTHQTNFILHGWGCWNLLKRKGVLNHILDSYQNVFLDISANSGYRTLMENDNSILFLQKYSKKILFGTDFPMLTTFDGSQFGANKQHYNLIKKLSKEARDNIFWKNAEQLIK